ncbi:MAG TPA: chromate resistance protein ChrB domain-containing protein [Gemmatimonadaceae bacterium]|nr:chromate resistance protein ChrB domain-containing protein [Gemmatimonadaceae bacterium]
MDASIEPKTQATRRRWLLFIHRLPPKPDYLRVKVARRLRKLGAVAVKKTVYALPASDEALEDFEWLRREVEAEGGGAVIAEAEFVSGISSDELASLFGLGRAAVTGARKEPAAEHVKPGSVWVTREDVHVDRIASAWLIRRFIDKRARFKFVSAKGYRHKPGELRFDMYDGEYTHAGSDCTFQTLVRRFALRDRALTAIGEVIHDLDYKDDRFNRPETAGTGAMIRAIVESTAVDSKRIERGTVLLEDLYAFFSRTTGGSRRKR